MSTIDVPIIRTIWIIDSDNMQMTKVKLETK